MSNLSHRLMSIEEHGDVTFITFAGPDLLDEGDDEVIRSQLTTYLETSGRYELLLDFGNVRRLSSSFLGTLMWLQRQVRSGGGSMRLFRLGGPLLEMFRLTKLDQKLTILKDSVPTSSAPAARPNLVSKCFGWLQPRHAE